MLSEEEMRFITRWETVREAESTFLSKLQRGIPMALLFALPILFSVAMVYFFSPEWYTKISQAAAGSSGMIIVSIIIFILFFSYFRMHFKWEMNEQLYMELKQKEKPECSE